MNCGSLPSKHTMNMQVVLLQGEDQRAYHHAHCQGIHNHLVFRWKISYMHVMPFDKLHPILTPLPILSLSLLVSFFPPLSSLSAAHMYMRGEPASGAEVASQWSPCREPALPQPWSPWEDWLSHSSHCWQRASQSEVELVSLPHPCWEFSWLDLLQALCTQSQSVNVSI